MRIKSQKDFFAGLLYAVVGIGFAWGATTYNIGDGARMGPGYFPLILGIVLAAIGGFVILVVSSILVFIGRPKTKAACLRAASTSAKVTRRWTKRRACTTSSALPSSLLRAPTN